jgi:PQQ-like domain
VVAADGTVYANDLALGVVALSPDGSTRWTAPIAAPDAGVNPNGTNAFALGADGTLYAWNGVLSAFHPDGTLAWSSDVTGFPGSYGMGIGPNGTLYVAGATEPATLVFDGNLTAFDPDGATLWQQTFGDRTEPASSPTVGPDGTIYLIVSVPGEQSLDAFDPDGTLAWTAPLGVTGTGGIVVVGDDGTVYASCAQALCTFTPAGQPIATFAEVGSPASAVVLSPASGLVYAGSGDVVALGADGGSPWLQVHTSPSLVDGRGTLYAYVPGDGLAEALAPDGNTLWTLEAGLPVAMGADGTVYTVSLDATPSVLEALAP